MRYPAALSPLLFSGLGKGITGESEVIQYQLPSFSFPIPPPGAGTRTECCTFIWVGVTLNEPGGLEPEPSPAGTQPPPLSAPKGDVQTHFMMIIFFSMPVLLSPQHNFSFHEISNDYIKFHIFEI